MTTINLTKYYSGFVNMANRYEFSDLEGRDDSCDSPLTFVLPDGYTVHELCVYDTAGIPCGIFEDERTGLPYLVSLAGIIPDSAPLTTAA